MLCIVPIAIPGYKLINVDDDIDIALENVNDAKSGGTASVIQGKLKSLSLIEKYRNQLSLLLIGSEAAFGFIFRQVMQIADCTELHSFFWGGN